MTAARDGGDGGALAEVRRLVLRHGRHACSYQVLDANLQHWLAADGSAAVGFVRRGRVWIAAGAPVAAPHGTAAAAAAFGAAARSAGARVLWFLAEQPLVDALGPGGAWLRVGAQPVWRPEQLQREFRMHGSLRQQLRRAANKGIAIAEWPMQRALASFELAHCLASWLHTRRAPPLHFLAGPLLLPDLRDRRVFVATRGCAPVAYLLLAPIAARSAWLVEQVVRGDGAANGTTESLLACATTAVAAEGAAALTLGCVPMSRRCGMQPPPGALGGALRALRRIGRRWYDFDGVDAFKAKFRPEAWEPLYLGTDAPPLRWRDLLALARAEAGGSVVAFACGALRRSVVRPARARGRHGAS